MSAHHLGAASAGFSIRQLAFIPRGLMRGFLTSLTLGPLIFCGELGVNDPAWLQDPLWIGGVIAGLALLGLVLRWFGEGRGILRGFFLALLSVGFINGVVALVGAGIGNADEALGLAIFGAVLVLVCGFILQRMERHRYG